MQGYCDFLPEEKLLEAVQIGQVIHFNFTAYVATLGAQEEAVLNILRRIKELENKSSIFPFYYFKIAT